MGVEEWDAGEVGREGTGDKRIGKSGGLRKCLKEVNEGGRRKK
jgi:hypothetical protein